MSDIYQFNVGGTTYNLANLGLLAPVQITLTADRLYNTGDQFIYTGLLYEATETIAQGTTITIGSNAKLADCVTKQISEINSNLSDIISFNMLIGNVTAGTTYAFNHFQTNYLNIPYTTDIVISLMGMGGNSAHDFNYGWNYDTESDLLRVVPSLSQDNTYVRVGCVYK